MNKKKSLLILAATSLSALVMTVVIVGQNSDIFDLEKTKANGPDYSLAVTSDNIVKSTNGFSIANSRGTNFYFGVNPNPKPKMKGEDYVVRYYGNQWGVSDPVALVKCENNAVDSSHPVNGIQSLTVNYSGKVGTGSDPSRPDTVLTIKYGFVYEGSCNYVFEDTLPASGTAFTFNNLLPNCFKIECDNGDSETWYEAKIESFSINYSCSESDVLMNAWLDDYFATAPKNIVKDGEENIVSFESGAYPQSKASSAASSYLDANYSLLSPVFGNYYFYDGSLYLREQAKASGYDNEYTVDSYYWFKVEPLKWNVLNSDGNSYFVTTEKVLNGKLAYHNNKSAQNVRYSDSSLKTSVEAMFDVTFRNVGTLIQLNSDERINAKLYPLSYSQYGSTASERICLPTDYARIFTTISSLSNGVQYWTNRIGYNNYDNKNYLIAITGNLSATTQDLAIAGVRPGMTITIE